MPKLTPLHDRILVRRLEQDQTTGANMVIPDSSKGPPLQGEVVQVASGAKKLGTASALNVKQGDRILFAKYAGTEVKVDNEDLLIMREEDVLGVIGAEPQLSAIDVNDPGQGNPKGRRKR